MSSRSLRARLLLLSGVTIIAALGLIGLVLFWVFDRQVHDRAVENLTHQLEQLAAVFSLGPDGKPRLERQLSDPRYAQPLSGLYWEVAHDGGPVLRSRSLWDSEIPLPSEAGAEEPKAHEAPGPGGSRLLTLSRIVSLQGLDGAPRDYRLLVALDTADMDQDRIELARILFLGLALTCLAFLALSWLQITVGLKPLDAIRKELGKVGDGGAEKLADETFPAEVRPLAQEINALLDQQRAAIDRARRRSGDLAHGLKTPLAAIGAHSAELSERGERALAEAIRHQVESMRRHVERELAVARSVGGQRGLAGTVRPALEVAGIVEVLRRLPGDERLAWSITGDQQAEARMDPADFSEVAGNLLDNARKWARSRIEIDIREENGRITIRVADDGPGIEGTDQARALERGQRLDEAVQGHGLGLSIVR
ncbi:MAG: ATP-binding protein, partial [Parvibaculaceae bacterium]